MLLGLLRAQEANIRKELWDWRWWVEPSVHPPSTQESIAEQVGDSIAEDEEVR